MFPALTIAQIQADPAAIALHATTRSGQPLIFRPLTAADAKILGAYFLGLSEETKRRYGPHPFDQPTADKFCAEINYAENIRWIGVIQADGQEQVIAYFIQQLFTPEDELKRYAQAGLELRREENCLIAPSVADAYQCQGIGVPLMRHIFAVARRLGFRHVLLMGGVYQDNLQAIRFYTKVGFRTLAPFMPTWPNAHMSNDMYFETSWLG